MLKLITIEGFERSGKDSLLSSISKQLKGITFYQQPTSESTGVSYRETEKFKVILQRHFKKMVEDLKSIGEKTSEVILTRFLISDNIYSDMFGRDHMLEEIIIDENCFQICPFVILWKEYSEYLKRVQISGSQIEYSEEEFGLIQRKFEENCKKYNGKCMFISNETTRDEICEEFLKFYKSI